MWMKSIDQQLRIDNAAASGDITLVTPGTGQSVKVHALRLSVAGAVIVTLKRGSTTLEVFNFAGAGSMPPLELRQAPYYQTGAAEALVLNASGAVQVNGRLEYVVS